MRAASLRSNQRFGVTQRLEFGVGVDLGVAISGGEVSVPEPAADHVDFDSGLEQVDCCSVSKDVWADFTVGADIIKVSGMATYDLVDTEPRQGLAVSSHEHRRIVVSLGALEQLSQQFRGLLP